MGIGFEVKRTVQAPIQEVYKGLLDLNAAEHWMQGLVNIERLDEGSMRVGSQWKETRKMFGSKATEHFEVIELQEPNKIVLLCDGTKGTTGKGEFVFTYRLTSSGEQTEIHLDGQINGLTGVAKFFEKMMAGTFKKACAKDMDALISHLENVKI